MPGIRKGKWSEAEDAELLAILILAPYKAWTGMAEQIGRTDVSVRFHAVYRHEWFIAHGAPIEHFC